MYRKYILALLAIIALTVFAGDIHAHAEDGTAGEPRPGLFEIRDRAQGARDTLEQRQEYMQEHDGELPPRPFNHPFTTGSSTDRFEQIRERFFHDREHFASTTALQHGPFSDEVRARILEHADHIAALTDAMVGRLTFILERMNTRIEHLQTAGVDTSVAEAAAADAADKIAEAEAAVKAVQEAMKAALESDTPRDEIEHTVKPLRDEAKTALRAAYQALRAVAEALPHPQEDTDETSS